MNTTELNHWLKNKNTVVIDGATGTNLQKMGLPIGASPETWVINNPEAVLDLYTKFVTAGSDIILSCTFGGNRIRLKHAELETKAKQVNQTAVALAQQATSGKDVLIAGSIGPTGEMMEPFGTLTEEAAFEIYQEQAQYLVDSGVDLLVIETQYDLNEALAAIRAVRSISDIALICSFSYDRGTRTMMGLKPAQVAEALNETDVVAIGVNCGKSLESNLEVLDTLNTLTDKFLWFKPNAGAPETDGAGSVRYNISPEDMGSNAQLWLSKGARFIGGCCGTSPEHLAAIKKSLKETSL